MHHIQMTFCVFLDKCLQRQKDFIMILGIAQLFIKNSDSTVRQRHKPNCTRTTWELVNLYCEMGPRTASLVMIAKSRLFPDIGRKNYENAALICHFQPMAEHLIRLYFPNLHASLVTLVLNLADRVFHQIPWLSLPIAYLDWFFTANLSVRALEAWPLLDHVSLHLIFPCAQGNSMERGYERWYM